MRSDPSVIWVPLLIAGVIALDLLRQERLLRQRSRTYSASVASVRDASSAALVGYFAVLLLVSGILVAGKVVKFLLRVTFAFAWLSLEGLAAESRASCVAAEAADSVARVA